MINLKRDEILSLQTDLRLLIMKLDKDLEFRYQNFTNNNLEKFADEVNEAEELVDKEETVIIVGILFLWCYSIAR